MKTARLWLIAIVVSCVMGSCLCGSPRSRAANGSFGAPCNTGAECASSFCCVDGDCPGGFCSNQCTSDADCPLDSICVDIGPYRTCMWSCSGDFDCPQGYCCRTRDGRLICRDC